MKKVLFVGCFLIAAAIAFLLRKQFENYLLFNTVWMLFKLSIAALICFMPYYLRRIRILGVFIPLGSISYMLYLINNDILALLEGNTYWYAVVGTLLLLVVVAVLFKWVCDKMSRIIEKAIQSKGKA